MGGIDHKINAATITSRPKINHSGPSTEKERIISGLHAPEVKAIIKNDREEARAGTEVFNVAMTVTSNPEFNFTVGRDGKPHERVANARATTGRGRGKRTKNLPRVTNKNLQRPLEAHADVGKQLKQVGGPKRKCSSNNTKAAEGTEKKRSMEVKTETLCEIMNEVQTGGKQKSGRDMTTWAATYLAEYSTAVETPCVSVPIEVLKGVWAPPPSPLFKGSL
nr:hypothetical protein CFP56_73746 [Quercus suber]